MAEIVAALGVPHGQGFPALVEREGPGCETAKLLAEVAGHLEVVERDALVIFDSDHLDAFLLDNLPIFSVGIADGVGTARRIRPGCRPMTCRSTPALPAMCARGGHRGGVRPCLGAGLDVDQVRSWCRCIFSPRGCRVRSCRSSSTGSRRRCRCRGAATHSGNGAHAIAGGRSGCASPCSPPAASRSRSPARKPRTASAPGLPIRNGRGGGASAGGAINDLLEEATSSRMLRAGNVGGELLELDRDARRGRRSQAPLHRAADRAGSRLRGLALGLSRERLRHQQDLLPGAA